jgi:hypothetical protein
MRASKFETFVYDLAYIAANKNFTEGGFLQMNKVDFVIRKRNIPSGIVIATKDHIELDGVRWEVNEIANYQNARSVVQLRCSAVGGSEVSA